MKQKVATTECNLAGKMSVLFCYMTLNITGPDHSDHLLPLCIHMRLRKRGSDSREHSAELSPTSSSLAISFQKGTLVMDTGAGPISTT